MKRICTPGNCGIVLLIVSGVFLGGCTVTREVGYGSRQTPPESLPGHLVGEQATVSTESGHVRGLVSTVTADTLFFQPDNSAIQAPIALREIRTVHIDGAGAQGPILGALGGGVVGTLIGGAMGKSGSGGWLDMRRDIGMIVGAGWGVIVGALLGAGLFPSSYEYVFPPAGSWGTSGTVIVRVSQVVESGDTITFRWGERTVTLPKSQLGIVREADGNVSLRMSRALLRQFQEN